MTVVFWVTPPDAAVRVKEYVPGAVAGVEPPPVAPPPEPAVLAELPLPPQPSISISIPAARANVSLRRPAREMIKPMAISPIASGPRSLKLRLVARGFGQENGMAADPEPGVVITLKVAVVEPPLEIFTELEAGAQVVPFGAPLQLSDTDPLNPLAARS